MSPYRMDCGNGGIVLQHERVNGSVCTPDFSLQFYNELDDVQRGHTYRAAFSELFWLQWWWKQQ